MSDKFPQVEMINVGGRSVIVPKVQHYKKGSKTETELTGHDNPFPTSDKKVLDELEQVKSELEAIKDGTLNVKQDDLNAKIDDLLSKQEDILNRLDGEFDTRLTGSNVEDALPVESAGSRVVEKQLLDREIRQEGLHQVFETSVDPQIRQAIIIFRVYGVTGNFESGEGYKTSVFKHTRGTNQAYAVAESTFTANSGNNGGNIFTIDPTFSSKTFRDDKYQLVQDTLFPSYRYMLWIEGTFDDGEGVDCDAVAYYIY